MKTFCEKVDEFVFEKTGKHIADLNYMDLPDEKERYNTRGFGHPIKTKSEADKEIERFLSMKLH